MAVGIIEALRKVLEDMGIPPHVIRRLLGGRGTAPVRLCQKIVEHTEHFFRYIGEQFALCTEYSEEDLLLIFELVIGDYPAKVVKDVEGSAQSVPAAGPGDRVLRPSTKKYVPVADHTQRDRAIRARSPIKTTRKPKQTKKPEERLPRRRKQSRPRQLLRVPSTESWDEESTVTPPQEVPTPHAARKYAVKVPGRPSDLPGPHKPTTLETVIKKLTSPASKKRRTRSSTKSTPKESTEGPRDVDSSPEPGLARGRPRRTVRPPPRLLDEIVGSMDQTLAGFGLPPLEKYQSVNIHSRAMSKEGVAARENRKRSKGDPPTKKRSLGPGVASSSRLRTHQLPSWAGVAIEGVEEGSDELSSSPERPRKRQKDPDYQPSSQESGDDAVPKPKGKGKGKGKKSRQ